MNREFADYLKKEWVNFPTYINLPPSVDPDTTLVKEAETKIPPVKNQKEEIPFKETESIQTGTGRLTISFFGMSLPVPFNNSYIIPVNNSGETTVSKA
ncbi:MAG: hypothetical protein LUH01_10805 [Parabacteroides gordonii]|nr:hypothetical protein [Parabacteroides gordonii]